MSYTRTLVLSLAAFTFAAAPVLADRPITVTEQPNAVKKLKWIGDYGLALALCRAEEKPLLVVIEEPKTPAFKMLPTALISQEANDKMLANYTLCRVDITTDYGRRVAECFKANEFPYTAIIDKRGAHILYKKTGKFDTRSWVTTLVEYKSGERKTVADEFCFT